MENNIVKILGELLSLAVFAAWSAGPNAVQAQVPSARKLKDRVTADAPLFTRLTPEQTGITFVYPIEITHPLKRLYISGYGGGAVAAGDVSGDGKPDVFLVSGPGENKLYVQGQDLKFFDATASAGVGGGENWGTGAALADIDNDGDLDLYVCNYLAASQLYINDGNGKFTDQAEKFKVDTAGTCMMPSFADYNRDGLLDLFLLNHQLILPDQEGAAEYAKAGPDGKMKLLPEFEQYFEIAPLDGNRWVIRQRGQTDLLFKQTKSGVFEDVSRQAGISDSGMGLAAVWWDYNEDLWPDLYVANDFTGADNLWVNTGKGGFEDKLGASVPHTTWFSMGADTADINNDGYWDLLVADMAGTNHFKQKLAMGAMSNDRFVQVQGPPPQLMRNTMLLGTGTGRFLESAYQSGIANTDWTWTVKFADFDNDGRVDVYFTNGMTRDFMDSDLLAKLPPANGKSEWHGFENAEPRREQNLVYRNLGDLQFKDASKDWGLDHVGMSYGAAHSDLDGDGDLDLVVMNLEEPPSVYRNNSGTGNQLLITLRGTKSNRFGIGAIVEARTTETTHKRLMQPVNGFNSSNEPILHFGLGAETRVSELTVRWPSGKEQVFKDVNAGQHLLIAEDERAEGIAPVRSEQPMFAANPALSQAAHHERKFDDFAVQSLLPNRMSQYGPGMAWGDIDGDADQDFFLSGAAGQAGQVFVNAGNSKFIKSTQPALQADKQAEDLGAVFIDADSDGDRDLYVVSGSVEAPAGDSAYEDRLYLNDGKGNFSAAPAGTLPPTGSSGSVVAAADYDRDGDVDLFVGGRTVPGKYPAIPESYLLRNDSIKGGAVKFTDAAAELAPGLSKYRMISSALWSDFDRDGWIDLLLAPEWGPITVWKNQEGKFANVTAGSGLEKYSGWWNGITGRDLDNDKDIDYVVTNFGLNTKYHASLEHPTMIYSGDFREDGNPEIVEAEYEHDVLFPVRGRGCSGRAMPFIKQNFPTYSEFAKATLPEIYSEQKLEMAERYEATTLYSAVLLNSGNGKFEIKALPTLAQLAPGFGVTATDVDRDGLSDIYLVQNFYEPQIETGKMGGGLSVLLRGTGNGDFDAIWPKDSGLVVPGDAKSLAALDLNGDQRVDFAIGNNDSKVEVFDNQTSGKNAGFAPILFGPPGNPDLAGALVEFERDDGQVQTAEVYAGSGYLAQSPPQLFFGLGTTAKAQRLRVHMPDGSIESIEKLDLPQIHLTGRR